MFSGHWQPRLDPLGVLDWLSSLSSRVLGIAAYSRLTRALNGEASLTDQHVLDLIGAILTRRELDA